MPDVYARNGASGYFCHHSRFTFVDQLISSHRFVEHLKQSCKLNCKRLLQTPVKKKERKKERKRSERSHPLERAAINSGRLTCDFGRQLHGELCSAPSMT